MNHPNFLLAIGLSMATITATAQILVPNHNPRGDQPTVPLEQNVFLGAYSGFNNTSGFYNVGIGNYTLYSNTTGYYNTANGFSALYSNTAGYSNTTNGFNALYANTLGSNNTANGYSTLYSNTTGSGNTANGSLALYSNTTGEGNTANGVLSLYANTTGYNNTVNGYYALYSNTTGYRNTANGSAALYTNTTGYNNTANGSDALRYNTTGYLNTANGAYALNYNTTGYHNTANGYSTLRFNTTGNYNTANGGYALNSNTTGEYNTANGFYALYSNTTGYQNTANGRAALNTNTTGYNNTANGFFTDVSLNNLYYASAFGSFAITNANNKHVIGRNTAGTVIGGYANWSNLSDGRFKENVKENVPGMAFIQQLRPVTYTVDLVKLQQHITAQMPDTIAAKYYPTREEEAAAQKEIRTGFIAQEVEEAAKKLGYEFDGVNAPTNPTDNYSIEYAGFVPSLVKGMQELSAENKALKQTVSEQAATIQQQNTLIAQQNTDIQAIKNTLASLGIPLQPTNGNNIGGNSTATPTENRLFQNIPNPLDKTTTIPYFIQENSQQAKITLVNTATGQVVKEWNSLPTGNGTIALDSALLAAGTYSYSLVVDGRLIAIKQMVIVR